MISICIINILLQLAVKSIKNNISNITTTFGNIKFGKKVINFLKMIGLYTLKHMEINQKIIANSKRISKITRVKNKYTEISGYHIFKDQTIKIYNGRKDHLHISDEKYMK